MSALQSRWLVLGACIAIALACSKPPPPDPDGVLEGARALPLDKPTEDALACDKRTNDCADWFRVRTKGQGKVVASVRLLADPDAERDDDDDDDDDERKNAALPEFTLELRDPKGELLQSVASEGKPQAEASAETAPGSTFAVVSSPGGKLALRYRVRAAFEPAAPPPPPPPPPKDEPPPPPRVETRSGAVLEVERGGGQDAVLIELGASAGIKPGLRGRLLDGGRELGAIVVVEVYPDGSRARVEGALLGQISPKTTAEIEIPLDPPPAP